MTKHLFIADVQAKEGVPMEHLSWLGQYIVDKKPDVIVQIGDFADMPSLSSYDKGKKSFEGRRYKKDIAAAKQAMDLLLVPMRKYNKKQQENKQKQYKPRMVLTLGNHECFPPHTEVLCRDGFKRIDSVTKSDLVLTLKGTWEHPTDLIENDFQGKLKSHSSRSISVTCTPNHRMYYESNGKVQEKLAKEMPLSCDLFVSVESGKGIDLTDEQIRFDAVASTDSHHTKEGSLVLYQSGSKADNIRNIIQKAGVEFRETSRQRDIIQICGKTLKQKCKMSYEFFMKKPEWCVSNNIRLPDRVFDMSQRQFEIYLTTLVFCDGSIPTKSKTSLVFYGKKDICEDLQRACVSHGYRASITEYREGQYRLNICKTHKCRVENFFHETSDIPYKGKVNCISVPSESFFIRDNNKVVAVGNCRIARAVEEQAELEGMLSYADLPYEDWEVIDFLKPIVIDGVLYAHYLANPMSGKPYSGTALNQLHKVQHSFCVGHKQTLDHATYFTPLGKQTTGIIAGAFYQHDEDYKGYQGNAHWRGVVMLHDVHEGSFDPMFISLDYLRRRYGE